MELDVTDTAAAQKVIQRVIQTAGRIDILVNNAGSMMKGWAVDTPLQDVRRLMEVCEQAATTRKSLLVCAKQRSICAWTCPACSASQH